MAEAQVVLEDGEEVKEEVRGAGVMGKEDEGGEEVALEEEVEAEMVVGAEGEVEAEMVVEAEVGAAEMVVEEEHEQQFATLIGLYITLGEATL